LELIEPLKYLYKDEVRDVAKKLGIPRDVYMRHPFPGPGYLVRIVGRVDREKLRIVKEADRIVEEELIRHGLYDSIWQGFAAILDAKSVGVKGDVRSYEYIIVIRLVESVDGMTARHVEIPYDILNNMAKRILDEVQGVNRVLYDLSDKPPSTIEFE
ncbi:MAG TPA: GMP synthase (glutamine-hydrolyzing), partial [Thermoprotei archaeon]|nr:GMP synthase (glutamine-hydrolyzing) [Thermoprotei archaeon]